MPLVPVGDAADHGVKVGYLPRGRILVRVHHASEFRQDRRAGENPADPEPTVCMCDGVVGEPLSQLLADPFDNLPRDVSVIAVAVGSIGRKPVGDHVVDYLAPRTRTGDVQIVSLSLRDLAWAASSFWKVFHNE